MTDKQLSPIGRFETLLLATDGTEYSASATEVAIEMGKKCKGTLHAMSCVITNPEYEALVPDRVEQEAIRVNGMLKEICATAGKSGVSCNTVLRHGLEPHKEICEEAANIRADVVVMGRRGKRGLARMKVGDATAKTIGGSPCSVLVVPRNTKMWSKGILIATDGSRSGDAAALVGGILAKKCNLPVVVLSAQRTYHSAERQAEAPGIVERVREFLEKDGVQVETIVQQGQPDEVIRKIAEERDLDLIVCGSHGRTGLGKVLLGGVTERVIGEATCPVLVVKG